MLETSVSVVVVVVASWMSIVCLQNLALLLAELLRYYLISLCYFFPLPVSKLRVKLTYYSLWVFFGSALIFSKPCTLNFLKPRHTLTYMTSKISRCF